MTLSACTATECGENVISRELQGDAMMLTLVLLFHSTSTLTAASAVL
jgi:hypothetical protein